MLRPRSARGLLSAMAGRQTRQVTLLTAGVCLSLGLVQVIKPAPRLIWNASASAPVGLFWLSVTKNVVRGDWVLAWLPKEARVMAARRHYLPADTPAVKRVAALGGDLVCVRGATVSINSRTVAEALPIDHAGLSLAPWRGCRLLADDELFLLNEGSPASFDGRYFGPSEREDVVGKLLPVLTFSR